MRWDVLLLLKATAKHTSSVPVDATATGRYKWGYVCYTKHARIIENSILAKRLHWQASNTAYLPGHAYMSTRIRLHAHAMLALLDLLSSGFARAAIGLCHIEGDNAA